MVDSLTYYLLGCLADEVHEQPTDMCDKHCHYKGIVRVRLPTVTSVRLTFLLEWYYDFFTLLTSSSHGLLIAKHSQINFLLQCNRSFTLKKRVGFRVLCNQEAVGRRGEEWEEERRELI